MPFFKIESRDGKIIAIVNAACKTCARGKMIEASPASEIMLWRNPELSKVTIVEELPEGLDKSKIILQRVEKFT